MSLPIELQRTASPRPRTPDAELGFGNVFTDHMFVVDYAVGRGWHHARVVPYGPLPLDPAAIVLHYAQTLFEGLKAFLHPDGSLHFFRPDMNAKRMNDSARRLCMPELPVELFVEGARAVVRADADWAPKAAGTSLYLRPTMIATEAKLGVRPATSYSMYTIVSPVGSYYGGAALKPVKIWVEKELSRAAPGGLGAAKTGANYAASLLAAERAQKAGYTQVLWTDAKTHTRFEEVGTMNLFVRIDDTVITPALDGSILPGVTRNSALALLKSWGVTVEERELTGDEVLAAARAGRLKEVWGTGTAAVISPVAELGNLADQPVLINEGRVGEVAQRLYDAVTGIQYGTAPDTNGWMLKV